MWTETAADTICNGPGHPAGWRENMQRFLKTTLLELDFLILSFYLRSDFNTVYMNNFSKADRFTETMSVICLSELVSATDDLSII